MYIIQKFCICWGDKFFSNSIKLILYCVWFKFLYWTDFHFIFLQFFLFINAISLLCGLFEPWIFCFFPSYFGGLFIALFRMLWMLVIVNKTRSSLRKTLVTFSKISAMRCTVFTIEFTAWKIFKYFHVYACLLPLL